MDAGNLWRLVRCLLLTALAAGSPAPVIAAKARPLVAPAPRDYLVRYLVFTISPAPGKDAWPDETPAILHGLPPLPFPALPTEGMVGFSAIELPFPGQLATREKAQQDLEAVQRKDPLYRYDLLFWGQERCFNGGDCLTLDGPAPDKWQTTVALLFAVRSSGPETVDLREGGKIRVSPGAMAGWEVPEAGLRLGKTYTKNADGDIPLKQIIMAFCIVPDSAERTLKPPPSERGPQKKQ